MAGAKLTFHVWKQREAVTGKQVKAQPGAPGIPGPSDLDGPDFEAWLAKVSKAAQIKPPRPYKHSPNELANLVPIANALAAEKMAPRCSYIKKGGQRCGMARMKGADRCCWHGGYRQAPTNKATVARFRDGSIAMAQAMDAARAEIRTYPQEDRQTLYTLTREAGAVAMPDLILTGLQAMAASEDDGGRAWRRWLWQVETLGNGRRDRDEDYMDASDGGRKPTGRKPVKTTAPEPYKPAFAAPGDDWDQGNWDDGWQPDHG